MGNDQSNPTSDNSISTRLMLDKGGGKIIYTEPRTDFVDMLFSFLVLPSGAIAKHALDSESTKTLGRIKKNLVAS